MRRGPSDFSQLSAGAVTWHAFCLDDFRARTGGEIHFRYGPRRRCDFFLWAEGEFGRTLLMKNECHVSGEEEGVFSPPRPSVAPPPNSCPLANFQAQNVRGS